jgi:hypothetical protein
MESENILGEKQAGFRRKYSTVDHVFVLNALIDFYLAKHKILYCGFIDFKKALDTIDQAALWTKLLSSGIICVIFNLYNNIKSCVKSNNGALSDFLCPPKVFVKEKISLLYCLQFFK